MNTHGLGIALGLWLAAGVAIGRADPAETSAAPAAAVAAPADTNASPAGTNAAPADTNATVITSTRMSFDQQQRVAIFDEHVVVIDPEIQIRADRLKVIFSEENKVKTILAEGHVTIEQKTLKALSDSATYDVQEGKVVLSGNPQIQRDRDALAGDTITFWRDTNRILCEPSARLIIHAGKEWRGATRPGE